MHRRVLFLYLADRLFLVRLLLLHRQVLQDLKVRLRRKRQFRLQHEQVLAQHGDLLFSLVDLVHTAPVPLDELQVVFLEPLRELVDLVDELDELQRRDVHLLFIIIKRERYI